MLVRTLAGILESEDIGLRLALVQLISTLGSEGYLRHPGGPELLGFLVEQAALPDEEKLGTPSAAVVVGASELQLAGERALQLLCSTVSALADVLWLRLWEALINPAYSRAAPVICLCLVQLATRPLQPSVEAEPGCDPPPTTPAASPSTGQHPSPESQSPRLAQPDLEPRSPDSFKCPRWQSARPLPDGAAASFPQAVFGRLLLLASVPRFRRCHVARAEPPSTH